VNNPGDVVVEVASVPFTAPSGWTIKGTADFNGDGETDVLASDGTHNQIWLLNNGVVSSTTSVGDNGTWVLLGIGDFNGDGHKDLLWQYGSLEYVHYLNGVTQIGGGYVSGQTADAVTPLSGSNQGIDTVLSSISYMLPTGVENLTLVSGAGSINGTGNNLDNVIIGNSGNNVITAGSGVDTLTGGAGADTFVFADGHTGSASRPDTITDFTPGTDQIDLTGIDANTTNTGHDAFHWLGTAAFDGQADELNTIYDASHNVTILEGDTNGDKVADFSIDLTGNLALSTTDFTAGSLQLPVNATASASGQTLYGGPLNDTLSDGGYSSVTMVGGAGNDTYLVNNPGDVVVEVASVPFTAPSGWTIKGTADFNGDGETDVLASDGTHNQIWLLNNGVVSSTTSVGDNGTWVLLGIGDFNGDGHKDLLWQYGSLEYVHYLNGVTQIGGGYVSGQTADAVTPLSGSNQGIDTVLSSISYMLPTGVENLTLVSGAGSINGTGNNLDNVIIGNEGNNILTGGGGSDTFVFKPNFGHDTIADFHPGQDLLQFDHTLFVNVSDVMSHTGDDGHGNAIITVDANNSVMIQNVVLATLQQHMSDFHIV